jgi:hypothetical protein
LLCATAAVADLLPPGTYGQHDEGGDHDATSSLGGYVVKFDDQLFVWTGSFYTNGLSVLEFFDMGDDEYAWILVCPDRWDTGMVNGGAAGVAPRAARFRGDA